MVGQRPKGHHISGRDPAEGQDLYSLPEVTVQSSGQGLMHILLTGLNHVTAPLTVRERVSFSKEQLPEALPTLVDHAGDGVILSTCNRTEVYTVTDEPEQAAGDVRRFLSDYHEVDATSLDAHLYDRVDTEAVRHLFRVAGGLDSMILGEYQILGQVRGALTAASESRSLRAPLSRLFHRAIRAGRRVRDETEVGRNALSISSAAVELAQRVLGNLQGARVLMVGAGETGMLVAKALRATGASDLSIANRTPERAEDLARELGGRAVSMSDVAASLHDADVVIAATEAPGFVLTTEDLATTVNGNGRRPLFLFDLSVPRSIEPEASTLDGVSLFNIDDLSAIAKEDLKGRKEEAAKAEQIVEEEVSRFNSWWESLEAVPLIRALRRKAERVRSRELERVLRGMPDLSPQDLEALDSMTRSIVNRLLHDPTTSMKQHAEEAHLRAARELFGLRDGSG